MFSENYETSSGSIVMPFKDEMESILNIFVESVVLLRKLVLNSFNTFRSLSLMLLFV